MDTKKLIFSIIVFSFTLFSLSSCDFDDNYDGPNANFHGQVIDKTTGKPFYSEQPLGFQVRFKEISWGSDAQPQNFYGKYDGSFNWDYLFGYTDKKYDGSPYNVATYEVELFDGAFVVEEPKKKTIEVKPGAKVEVNFEVTPLVSLVEEHSLNGNLLTVKYSMTRNVSPSTRLQQSGVIISSRTQYLSGGLNEGGFEKDYSKFRSAPQLISYRDGTQITETITLESGKTYWMRTGAKQSDSERWNYTEVIEIKVP